jgi:hypothetical protein
MEFQCRNKTNTKKKQHKQIENTFHVSAGSLLLVERGFSEIVG